MNHMVEVMKLRARTQIKCDGQIYGVGESFEADNFLAMCYLRGEAAEPMFKDQPYAATLPSENCTLWQAYKSFIE